MLPEHVDVICPEDGSDMVLRTGRFGKFLASVNYPDIKFVLNLDKKEWIKYPAVPPLLTDLTCEKCESPLNLRRGKRGPWLGPEGECASVKRMPPEAKRSMFGVGILEAGL